MKHVSKKQKQLKNKVKNKNVNEEKGERQLKAIKEKEINNWKFWWNGNEKDDNERFKKYKIWIIKLSIIDWFTKVNQLKTTNIGELVNLIELFNDISNSTIKLEEAEKYQKRF